MKNIEFRASNKFGGTYREQFNGRKFTLKVKNEAAERNISTYQVIVEFVKQHYLEFYSQEPITYYEFSWRDEFNYKHTISQSL